MPARTLFFRSIRFALRNLARKERWMASGAALFCILLLLQIFSVTSIGIEQMEGVLRSRDVLRLELRDSATDQRISTLYGALQELPAVERVTYVSREQAYAQAKKAGAELAAFAESFGGVNPFRGILHITLKSWSDHDALAAFLGENPWREIIAPTAFADVLAAQEKMAEFSRSARASGFAIAFLLAVAALALMSVMTERLRRDRERMEDISTEQLLGADGFVIGLPLWIETTLLLLIGIVMSFAVLLLVLVLLPLVLQVTHAPASLLTNTLPLLNARIPALLLTQCLAAPIAASIVTWWTLKPSLATEHLLYGT